VAVNLVLAAPARSGHLPSGGIIGLGVLLLLVGAGLVVAMSMRRAVDYSLTHDPNYYSTPRLTGGEAQVRIWATRLSGVAMVCAAIACFVYAA
jgi:hypothetical protein